MIDTGSGEGEAEPVNFKIISRTSRLPATKSSQGMTHCLTGKSIDYL